MTMIGGNTDVIIQQKTGSTINAIGEKVQEWTNLVALRGWLDLSAGDSKYTHDTKLQESTHIFLCDYVAMDRKATDKRLKAGEAVYDILLIDDPMELHQQLEIYLRFVG